MQVVESSICPAVLQHPFYTATNTGHTLVNTGQINKNPLSGTGQTIGDANLAIINGGVGGGGINVHEGTLVIGGALTLNPAWAFSG